MKIDKAKLIGTILGILAAIVIFATVCVVSWLVTCGIIKLITLCFGWTFTWSVATGVWLCMFLARFVLNRTIKVKGVRK